MKKLFTLLTSLILCATCAQANENFDMTSTQFTQNNTVAVSPLSSPELQMYSLEVGKKIISNFKLLPSDGNLATLVIFKIDAKGNLLSSEITQKSGNADYDKRVLAAVKKSSPYPPPTFQQGEEAGVVLNMDASLIKLVKMLTSDQPANQSQIKFYTEKFDEKAREAETQTGKKFVNPDWENLE